MRTLLLACSLALAATALGCRANNGQVLVEQEARMFESEVYALEAELDACCQAKESLARENEELRRQLAGGSGGDYRAPAATSAPPARRAPLTEAPRLEAPSIELPEATTEPPDTLFPGDQEPATPDAGDSGALGRQPSELVINRRMTGGLDRDRAGGDEGLMVLVEPRDDQGRLVRTPGAVSVVVMDPAKRGDAARIARWDFQAHEFEQHFKKSAFGQGLLYELQWPDEPPDSRDLLVFVRYVTPQGTKLTTDAPLNIRLAGDYPREATDRALVESEPARTEPATDSTADRSQVTVASRSEPQPTKPLIGPREARDNRPKWKPYR